MLFGDRQSPFANLSGESIVIRNIKIHLFVWTIFCAASTLCAQTVEEQKVLGVVEVFDGRFEALVPHDAQIEILAEGFDWAEGPVWVKEGGYLLFSDIPPNRVMRWKEGEGLSVFLDEAGYFGDDDYSGEPGSNGLLINGDGDLILCEHGNRRVGKLSPIAQDGERTAVVDNHQGKKFNSPNDGVFNSNGDLYFTDPPYGLPQKADDPSRELRFLRRLPLFG